MERTAMNDFALLAATTLGTNYAAILPRASLHEALRAWLKRRARKKAEREKQERKATPANRAWPE